MCNILLQLVSFINSQSFKGAKLFEVNSVFNII